GHEAGRHGQAESRTTRQGAGGGVDARRQPRGRSNGQRRDDGATPRRGDAHGQNRRRQRALTSSEKRLAHGTGTPVGFFCLRDRFTFSATIAPRTPAALNVNPFHKLLECSTSIRTTKNGSRAGN